MKKIKPYKVTELTAYIMGIVADAQANAISGAKVLRSSDADVLIRPDFIPFMKFHEEFWVILLNRRNGHIGNIKISQGGLSGTVVDQRIIMQHAILSNASSMVLVHNHPSGEKRPSEQDILITKRMVEVGKIHDINIIDHLILTEDSFYSFADEGLLN